MKVVPSDGNNPVSINLRIHKQNVVYPHNGLLFSLKKEWSSNTSYNMDELWKHYAKWKKPETVGHVLYDSIYMKCPE